MQTLFTQLHVQAFPSLVLVMVLVLVAVAVIVSSSLFSLVLVLVLVLVCSTVGLLVLVVDTVTLVVGDPMLVAVMLIGLFLAPTQASPTPMPETNTDVKSYQRIFLQPSKGSTILEAVFLFDVVFLFKHSAVILSWHYKMMSCWLRVSPV